jgi:ABC-2 type transport system ATP-binding protein
VSDPTLVLSRVTKDFRYRRGRMRAVDGVSFELRAGEIVGLVGPCGAGTTTLLRLAAGVLAPDDGTVQLEGAPIRSWRARRVIGFAPENPVFPPTLTVRETLEYFARFHVAGAARRTLVGAALELGGLETVATWRASLLPRSWTGRLALAQATLGARRVLLLDQTLSGLDPLARRELGERLRRCAGAGMAVLLASHEPDVLERIVSRAVVLRRGAVVRNGALATLLRHRVLEIVLDRPPAQPPPGFRVTAIGLETDLEDRTVEAALALCRLHRLAVRASRVRYRSLEDAVLDACDAAPR